MGNRRSVIVRISISFVNESISKHLQFASSARTARVTSRGRTAHVLLNPPVLRDRQPGAPRLSLEWFGHTRAQPQQ